MLGPLAPGQLGPLAVASVSALTFDQYMSTISPAPLWWFEGDKISGATDNTALSTWQDHATMGDVTAVTTARPTYLTNILNGLPVARFNGTANQMSRASVALASVSSATAATIIIAQRNDPASNGTPFDWYPGGSIQFDGLVPLGGLLYWDHGNISGAGRVTVGVPAGFANKWHIVIMTKGGGTGTIRADGATLLSTAMSTSLSGGPTTFFLGGFGGSFLFKGDMYLVIGFGALLSDAQINDITNLLAVKTGILVTTP